MLDEDDKPLVSVCPSDSLLDAIFHLSYGKVHRLLVVNPDTGNALHVLTYRRILRFIHICVCINSSLCLSVSVCLSLCMCVCLSVSLCLSVHPSVCVVTYLFLSVAV